MSPKTFSPVIRTEVIRIIIGIAAQKNLKLNQADVSTAFLYGRKKEKIYLELPRYHQKKDGNRFVWETRTALYGLDDACQIWNRALDDFLRRKEYIRCTVEPCLYKKKDIHGFIILIIYVDDLLYIGSSNALLNEFEKDISERFKIKFTSDVKRFIGYDIYQQKDSIFINQEKYIKELSEIFEVSNFKEFLTPMEEKLVLSEKGEKLEDIRLYQAITGSILYANMGTRADVSFSTNQLSRFMSEPRKEHLGYAKRVFKILTGYKGIRNQVYKKGFTNHKRLC